jgi:hypothetical protein
MTATPDTDNSLENAFSIGGLNSGQIRTFTGDVTATDDREDFRRFNTMQITINRLMQVKLFSTVGTSFHINSLIKIWRQEITTLLFGADSLTQIKLGIRLL